MKVKINTHGNALPEVHGEWIDLCTAEDVTLDFLEYKIISLGVSIEIPAGYYAHVVPRSSTFGKWGILLANSMGVIENDYCGDGDVWGYPALCLRKEGTRIPKGTRICQFRLVEKAPDMEFVQVESLGNRDRGGFGSTGEQVHTGGTAERNKPERNSRVERMFGAGETRRIQHAAPIDEADKKYEKHYPLYEWGWTREECVHVIERAGLPRPGKSSCFFCPSMKKKEIQALWENYPDLFERAIALEHGSAKTNVNVKGLGRDWSWESYYNEFMANKEFEEAQLTFDQLFPDSPGGCICGAPCGCYDG